MQTDHSPTHRREVAASAMPRLLTLRDVTQATALSRSAVYALMAESRFPKPIRIGSRAVRWVEQEVLDFIASRPRGGNRAASRLAGTDSSSGAGWRHAARRPHLPDAAAPDPRASTCPREPSDPRR